MGTLLTRTQEWLRVNLGNEDFRVHQFDIVNEILDGKPVNVCHILVVDEEVKDELAPLIERNKKKVLAACEATVKSISKEPRPSEGVHSPSKVIRTDDGLIHGGRPYLNYALSPALYNATLARLDFYLRNIDEELEDLIPDHILCNKVHQFMSVSLDKYANEELRQQAIRVLMESFMSGYAEWQKVFTGCKPTAIWGDRFPFVVLELKNEFGLEDDATLQAELSYAKIVAMDEYREWRKATNLPVILIVLMSSFLEIVSAVFVDGVSPSVLFSQRLELNNRSYRTVLRVAKAFQAVSIAAMRRLYSREPPPPRDLAHLFPSPTRQAGDPLPTLTFTHRMSRTGQLYLIAGSDAERRSGLFVATMPDPNGHGGDIEVIVKFAERYNAEVHRLLAKAGFGPNLYACVRVMGDLYMVVMEYTKGKSVWTLSQTEDGVPYEVYEDIDLAISKLDAAGFVFGDLRLSNIFCVRGAGDGSKTSGRLLDYDWAGTHGKDKYPTTFNHQLGDEWATGMVRYGVMRKEHDLEMLEKLRVVCRPKLSVA